jgi:DNA-binding MarR family transcriptional regulator
MATRAKREIAEDVWRTMARLTFTHVQRGDHVAMLREQGLTPGHLKTLGMLDPDAPRPMGALADGMNVDASQVTWLVDRLEERGFVERRALPSDRRVKTVALTPSGVAFRRTLLEHLAQPPPELTALDAATLRRLLDDLSKIPAADGETWSPFTPAGS